MGGGALDMDSIYEYDLKNYGHIDEIGKIICPYCGYGHELNSDYFETGDEFEDEDFQCNECENYFIAHGRVEYEFWATTTPLPEEKRL